MYLNTVSAMGGDDCDDTVVFVFSNLSMDSLPFLLFGGILATTAHESKIKGATTKKATATLKSNHTKDLTHASLAALMGGSTVSGRKNMSNAEAEGDTRISLLSAIAILGVVNSPW